MDVVSKEELRNEVIQYGKPPLPPLPPPDDMKTLFKHTRIHTHTKYSVHSSYNVPPVTEHFKLCASHHK